MSPETILPAASTSMDLRAMLELIQAATDTKKAKAFLDKLDEVRADLEGKLVEIAAREKAAAALEEKADKAVARSEAASNKAITEQANLATMKQALTADEEAFKAQRDASLSALAKREADLDQAFANVAARAAELESGKANLAQKLAAVDIRLADLESIKAGLQAKEADLNERLNKLRALAE